VFVNNESNTVIVCGIKCSVLTEHLMRKKALIVVIYSRHFKIFWCSCSCSCYPTFSFVKFFWNHNDVWIWS